MRTPLTILAISAGSFLIGSEILGVFVGGPAGILAGPLLAIFGWFYFLPIVAVVSAFWFGFRPFMARGMARYFIILAGAVAGGAFMGYFGIKEEGRILFFTCGYATGGSIAGLLAVWSITSIHPAAIGNKG